MCCIMDIRALCKDSVNICVVLWTLGSCVKFCEYLCCIMDIRVLCKDSVNICVVLWTLGSCVKIL